MQREGFCCNPVKHKGLSTEHKGLRLSTGNGMEKKANILKTGKLTRKRVLEYKRKEVLRFLDLVYDSYKD